MLYTDLGTDILTIVVLLSWGLFWIHQEIKYNTDVEIFESRG